MWQFYLLLVVAAITAAGYLFKRVKLDTVLLMIAILVVAHWQMSILKLVLEGIVILVKSAASGPAPGIWS